MNKQAAKLIFLMLLSVVLLTGCFGKKAQKDDNKNVVILNYYKPYTNSDVMRNLIMEFNRTQPRIKINYKKFDSFERYWNLILNELAEGEGPDIFAVPNSMIKANFKKFNAIPHTVYSPEQFEAEFLNVATQSSVFSDPISKMKFVWGIPLAVDSLAIYYNKAHYESTIPERGKPAMTWGELQSDCVKLNKVYRSSARFQRSCIAMGIMSNVTKSVDALIAMIIQLGGSFYSPNLSGSLVTACNGNVCPVKDAIKIFTTYANPNHKNYSWNSSSADRYSAEKELMSFIKGDVSMIIGNSYTMTQLSNLIKSEKNKTKTITESEIGVSHFPQFHSNLGETKVAFGNFNIEVISRTTKHPKEALMFLRFLAKKEAEQKYSNLTNSIPARRDLIVEKFNDPIYKVFAEQAAYTKTIDIFNMKDFYLAMEELVEAIKKTNNYNYSLQTFENFLNSSISQAYLNQK